MSKTTTRTSTLSALMLIAMTSSGCFLQDDEESDNPSSSGTGGDGAASTSDGGSGGSDSGGSGGGDAVGCSTDGVCNADCHATLDADCVGPAANGSDVTPPAEMPACTNVQTLAANFMDAQVNVTLSPGADACVVYDVTGSIGYGTGSTLNIEAGVTLRFSAGTGVRVTGAGVLNVNGTPSLPVLFTGTEALRGHWEGIYFDNGLDFNHQPMGLESRLSHAIVEYGGAGNNHANVTLHLAHVAIENSLLRESSEYGLELHHASYLTSFQDNVITSNASGAVQTFPQWVHELTDDNDYRGNDSGYVDIMAESDEVVLEPRTWQRLNAPYRLKGLLTVQAPLTIEPGTRFVAAADAQFNVWSMGGGLIAEGTPELPIVFEGEDPTPGSWWGIRIENSDYDGNVLAYVAIRHGGDANVSCQANFCLKSSLSQVLPRADVHHCLFTDSVAWGVIVQNSTTPDGLLDNNTFLDNADGELREFNN